jgi:hypothetical protein
MGIDPNFDLWSPFFHVQLSQGEEAMVLSGMDIYVKSEHGVDPYICLPISESTDKWQKVWFFLRNNADTPLPMFTGSRSVPKPNRGYRVAKRDLCNLQSMRKVIQ